MRGRAGHSTSVNRDVYDLLRYGVKVKADVGEQTQTVWLMDWANPTANHFAIAEEVAVKAAISDGNSFDKRPDVVIYVNGIALGVLELKRSTASSAGKHPGLPRPTSFLMHLSNRFMPAGQPVRAGLSIIATATGDTCPFSTLSDWQRQALSHR